MWAPRRAEAALLQFPTASLRNKYFLVKLTELHPCLMSQHVISEHCHEHMLSSNIQCVSFMFRNATSHSMKSRKFSMPMKCSDVSLRGLAGTGR